MKDAFWPALWKRVGDGTILRKRWKILVVGISKAFSHMPVLPKDYVTMVVKQHTHLTHTSRSTTHSRPARLCSSPCSQGVPSVALQATANSELVHEHDQQRPPHSVARSDACMCACNAVEVHIFTYRWASLLRQAQDEVSPSSYRKVKLRARPLKPWCMVSACRLLLPLRLLRCLRVRSVFPPWTAARLLSSCLACVFSLRCLCASRPHQ